MVFRQKILRVVLCATHNINKAETEGAISALRQVALMPTEQERKELSLFRFIFFGVIESAMKSPTGGGEEGVSFPPTSHIKRFFNMIKFCSF